MDNHKIKKIIITAILSLLTLAAVTLKSSLTPTHQYMQGTLCSLDGEQISVLFDVTWYPHLFKPTELRGTIYINDDAYKSITVNYGDSFIDQLKAKFSGSRSCRFLFYASRGNLLDADSLDLYVPNSGFGTKNFELLHIDIYSRKQRKMTSYYGPAMTAKEAYIIFQKFYPHIEITN